MSTSENNKRIAKNTIYLYVRMMVFLLLGLFTSRITLNALGVHDYGLLNVVGGILGILGFFSGLLTQGSARFLTIGLGKGNYEELKKTFSACLSIHLVIAALILLLGEIVGVWFVNEKLVISPERMNASNWVFQFSLFTASLTVVQSLFTSSIIAHEKMSAFAFMSILDAFAKLVVVMLLLYVNTDKLILYSAFYFGISILVFTIYYSYCISKFKECSTKLIWDTNLYKEIWNYSGWNSLSAIAFTASNQGITVLLNLAFSTVVNAARGIATTVSTYVFSFVTNFMMATRPQVFKLYAQRNYKEMNNLIMNTAKYSAFLIILIGLPVFIETPFLIQLWLGQVPEYVIPFVRITLIQLLLQSLDFPIGTGLHAVGKMKLPNLTSVMAYMSVLPLTYLFLQFYKSPTMAYVISAMSYPVALCCDLWILNKYTGFVIRKYIQEVILKVGLILGLSTLLPLFIEIMMEIGWQRFLIVIPCTIICSAIFVYFIGLDKVMQKKLLNMVFMKIKSIV